MKLYPDVTYLNIEKNEGGKNEKGTWLSDWGKGEKESEIEVKDTAHALKRHLRKSESIRSKLTMVTLHS